MCWFLRQFRYRHWLPGGADSSADINTDDVTIESTNSFGALIAQAVEAEEDSSSGGDEKDALYSITDIVVQGSTATVTYDSAEEAMLIVALYTEDGMQLLNTAAVTVSPEEKTAYATFEGELPEYFLISAYLLDVYDNSPLCSSYETPMYTSDMQELLAMDVEDCIEEYGEDRLFNLDENSETNFAVYADTTIVLEEVPGVNVVVSADEETKTYILDKVDERITGLIPGNIVFYTYGDGEILIFKVDTITLDGAMAIITGGELELDEVFSLMKLESEGDPSNMTMDTTDTDPGLTYEGITGGENPRPLDSPDHGVSPSGVDIGGSVDFAYTFSIKDDDTPKPEKPDRVFNVEGEFDATLKFSLKLSLNVYISTTRQYVEFKANPGVEYKLKFEGKITIKGAEIAKFGFMPVSGVFIEMAPRLELVLSGEADVTLLFSTQIGFAVEHRSGGNMQVRDLCKGPSADLDVKFEGKIFFGFDLHPKIKILSDAVASASMTTMVGAELSGTLEKKLNEEEDTSSIQVHDCDWCVDGELAAILKVSIKVKFLNSKKLSVTKELLNLKAKLFEFYYSLDLNKFGKGDCPNYRYRVRIHAMDRNQNNAKNVTVKLSNGKTLGKTNENGILDGVYLSKGNYTFVADINGEPVTQSEKVYTYTTVTMTSSPEYWARRNALKLLMIMPDDVSASSVYKSGVCGDKANWKLYASGLLEITGSGAMDDYNSASNTPWYTYRDKITSLRVGDKVTRVSQYAFSGLTGLKKVIIEDSVTHLGERAFYNCTGLTEVKLPVDIDICCSSDSYSPFYGCTNVKKIHYTYGQTGDMNKRLNTYSSSKPYYSYYYALEGFSAEVLESVYLDEGIISIGGDAFYNCKKLGTVWFAGDAPAFASNCFYGVTANAHYPAGNDTWTESVRQNYGGTMTWIAEEKESGAAESLKLMYAAPAFVSVPADPVFIPEINGNTATPVVMPEINGNTAQPVVITCQKSEPVDEFVIEENAPTIDAVYGGMNESEFVNDRIIQTSTFEGLVPGENYVMFAVVSTDTDNLFAPENILFIDQDTADTDGRLVFRYVQRSSVDDFRIFACGASYRNLNDAQIIFPEVHSNGETMRVTPTVIYDGETLVEYVDYVIVDGDFVTDSGEYVCTIRGICNYTGLVTVGYSVEDPLPPVAEGWSGDTTWVLRENGVLTFSGTGNIKSYGYGGGQPWLEYADQITSIVINEGVTGVGTGAFMGLTALETVRLPDTLTRICEAAFYESGLTSVEIPATLYTIQPYTFKNCANLTSVIFHEGNLQKISDGAFYGTGLTELVLPDCLDILDVYAFKGCENLTSITIGSGLTELREAVFYGTAITTIEIPEGITKIGSYAFKNCVALESIDLPESLTSVGEASFYADTALKIVELPDAVTGIGNYAFRKCEALETLKLSAELVTVGECAFYGCTSLTELVIPGKVTTIKPYAFKTCTDLTSVELGNSVETIGEGAFNTCTGIKTIVFPASLKTIGDYCFANSENLWQMTFEGDAPGIGTGAFKGLNATACYPGENATWTAEIMQNYGGTITWEEN